jgi:hypothetical protein
MDLQYMRPENTEKISIYFVANKVIFYTWESGVD